MEAQEIWQAALGALEVTLSKANYTTWFKGTQIVSISDEEIIIGVPNNFTKEWLRNKYHPDILATLKKLHPPLQKIDYKVVTTPAHSAPLTIDPISSPKPETSATPALSAFNPKYTFDSFIVGNNNRLAHATSLAVAEKPGEAHNPLFIYGGVGLGKTHLIHAISNEIRRRYPNKKVLYVSCEKFTNEFIQAITAGRINDFKNIYRNVDVLLVDDIQFLSHKEGTQEEFFHTFNALHQTNRQIVITSDRVPKAIPDLEDRLSSRFGWGMVADVRPPNLETRHAILRAKCEEKKYNFEPKILDYIAQQITSNIRELEGALNLIASHHTLYNTEPSLDTIKDLLVDVVAPSRTKNINPDHILRAITKFFNIELEELLSARRNKELVYPRQITMYLLRHEINMSFPHIGRELGGKDHTTIMHGCNKIAKELAKRQDLQQDLSAIKEILYN